MNQECAVGYASEADIDAWMDLVALVRDAFPGLSLGEYRGICGKPLRSGGRCAPRMQGGCSACWCSRISTTASASSPYILRRGGGASLRPLSA